MVRYETGNIMKRKADFDRINATVFGTQNKTIIGLFTHDKFKLKRSKSYEIVISFVYLQSLKITSLFPRCFYTTETRKFCFQNKTMI